MQSGCVSGHERRLGCMGSPRLVTSADQRHRQVKSPPLELGLPFDGVAHIPLSKRGGRDLGLTAPGYEDLCRGNDCRFVGPYALWH